MFMHLANGWIEHSRGSDTLKIGREHKGISLFRFDYWLVVLCRL